MQWKDEVRSAMAAAGITSARALAARLDRREATVGEWLRGKAEPWESDKPGLRRQLAELAGPQAARVREHAPGSWNGSPFASEERRRGYLEKVLEDAARAIHEARVALMAPVGDPRDDIVDVALELDRFAHLRETAAPAQKRRSK